MRMPYRYSSSDGQLRISVGCKITGTVGRSAGHVRVQPALNTKQPKPLAFIFEVDAVPEEDLIPR